MNNNPAPTPKVVASAQFGGLGGAFTVITVWILNTKGIIVPPEVIASIASIFTVAAGFIGGYLTKEE